MRAFAALLLALTFPAAAGGQGAPPAPTPVQAPRLESVPLPRDLDRVLRDYEFAWQKRDAAALARLFTADGLVLSNGKPPVRGRSAIALAYADGGGPLSLRAVSYSVADSVGYIVGAYAERAGEPDIGKFVLALRRQRGGPWEIAADIDNTNERPRRGPPAGARPDSAARRRPPR
jgi:ketosteroid isomerase-like protein